MACDLPSERPWDTARPYPGPRLSSPKRYAAENEEGKPQMLVAAQFRERLFSTFPHALTKEGRCLYCDDDGKSILWDKYGPASCQNCGFEFCDPARNSGRETGRNEDSSSECLECLTPRESRDACESGSISSLGELAEPEIEFSPCPVPVQQVVPGGRLPESWIPDPNVEQLRRHWEESWIGTVQRRRGGLGPRPDRTVECPRNGDSSEFVPFNPATNALGRAVAELHDLNRLVEISRVTRISTFDNAADLNARDSGQDLPMPEHYDLSSQGLDTDDDVDASDTTIEYPEDPEERSVNETETSFEAMSRDVDAEYAALLAEHEMLRKRLSDQDNVLSEHEALKRKVSEQEMMIQSMRQAQVQNLEVIALRSAQRVSLSKDVASAMETIVEMRRSNRELSEEMSRLRIEVATSSQRVEPVLPETATEAPLNTQSGGNPPIFPVTYGGNGNPLGGSESIISGGYPSTQGEVIPASTSGRNPSTVNHDVVVLAPSRMGGAGRLPPSVSRVGVAFTVSPSDANDGDNRLPEGGSNVPDQGFESASNHQASTPDRSSSRPERESVDRSHVNGSGPPSDPSNSSSSSSDDEGNDRRGRHGRGDARRRPKREKRRPEASEIKVPTFPSIIKYDEWCTEMADAVMAASGRGDKAWDWIRRPSMPLETFGSLKESGDKYNSLDAKLAKALRTCANGNSIHHVRIKDEFNRGTAECNREGRPIKGRQLLLLVHKYYRTNEELGTQYGPKHLYLITCPNDKKLETFLTQWFTMLSKLNEPFPESMLRDHFLSQMKNCACMEHAIKNYNDLSLGDPKKCYNTLVMAAQRQVSLRRQDEMDRAIAESLSGKAAPAQATSGQVGHCKYWIKGGCTKGESCMYKHDPSKKNSKSGSSEKGKASAKAAPATEKSNKQGGKGNQKPRERSKDGRSSNKGDKRTPDDAKRANPCYEFANGKCTRGANCSFEHRKLSNDERERMRSWSARSKSRDKDKPRQPRKPHSSPAACAAYLGGSCSKGHMCRLAHVDLPVRQAIPAMPVSAAPAVASSSKNGQTPVIQILGGHAASSKHAPALVGGSHSGFAPHISRDES